MKTIKLVILIAPWLLIVVLLFKSSLIDSAKQSEDSLTTAIVLQEIETMGKLELIRYNFKEIVELKELSERYWQIFQLGPDSKIALICEGEVVGCIDLEKITDNDIKITPDQLVVRLPEPEVCYYKLDMSKTRIYSLQTNPFKDEKKFIEKAYKNAEETIRKSALSANILDQTRANAEHFLRVILGKLSEREVVFVQTPLSEEILTK